MKKRNESRTTESVIQAALQKLSLTNWLLIIFIMLMWWWHVETEHRLDEIIRVLGR